MVTSIEGPAPETRGRPLAMSRAGVPAFSTACARWAAPDNWQSFTEISHAALRELQASATTIGAQTGVRA
jgi:hypothetical protein